MKETKIRLIGGKYKLYCAFGDSVFDAALLRMMLHFQIHASMMVDCSEAYDALDRGTVFSGGWWVGAQCVWFMSFRSL